MSRVTEVLRAQDLGARFRQPDQHQPGWVPPSVSALLPSNRSSGFGDPGEVSSYSKSSREPGDSAPCHVLRPTPKVVLEQSKKYAMGALDHFNKRKKIKFELMDVKPVSSMPESCSFYTHVNFTARSSKEGSQEELFFAELQLCSRRQASSGFIVTCCEPLGPDYTVGHKGLQLDGSVVRKNVNFTRCFACSPTMLHPQGEKYIAGHCNIPYIYNSPY